MINIGFKFQKMYSNINLEILLMKLYTIKNDSLILKGKSYTSFLCENFFITYNTSRKKIYMLVEDKCEQNDELENRRSDYKRSTPKRKKMETNHMISYYMMSQYDCILMQKYNSYLISLMLKGCCSLIIVLFLLTTGTSFQNRGHVHDTNLTLYWEFIDQQTFDFKIVWKQYSFLALMFTNSMANTDLWVCSCQNETSQLWSMNDQWTLDHKRPQNDTTYNATDDFMNKFAANNSVSETITCGFRRKFNTGDPFDVILKKGESYIITAIKSTTKQMKKHLKDMSNVFYFQWDFVDGFDGEIGGGGELNQFNWALFHGIVLTICWGLFVDFSLILVRYFRLMKLYVLAHGVSFFVINLLTLPLVLYMIIVNGEEIFFQFNTLEFSTKIHFVIGIIFIGIITIQHIFGVITKLRQQSKVSPANNYLLMKKFHRTSGYIIYLISKIQLLIGWWTYMGDINFVVKIIFAWIIVLGLFRAILEYLYRKNHLMFLLKYFKSNNSLSKEDQDTSDKLLMSVTNEAESEFMQEINSGKQTKQQILQRFPNVKFVHFKNLVCNVGNFSHPGGDSLIEYVIGQEISKYIYGGAGVEGNLTKHHKHSQYVIKYLQNNVIGIKTQKLMGVDQESSWTIKQIKEVSPHFFKFTINNPSLELKANPEDITQYVGKFLLVTPATRDVKKVNTRTYTLLLSQLEFNSIYRNRLLQGYKKNFEGNFVFEKFTQTKDIVLMIKRYEFGTTSRHIHHGVEKIEGLYGVGLQLEKGLNVIVTGGSGILPFLDLFDTLLRKVILTVVESRNKKIQNYNIYNLNYKSVFAGFKFVLYASFTNLEEFKNNYEWLVDLAEISKSEGFDIFELHLKIPQIGNQFAQIPKFNEFINASFIQKNLNQSQMKKIYVCGPPIMNNSLFEAFKERGYESSKYRIL